MRYFLYVALVIATSACLSCRRADPRYVTIALPEKFSTLDTLTSTASDSAAERVRNLLFNSLVKKNENFEYVGELASDIKRSDDGLTLTFTLREGITFHNGQPLTSADVKYTFDELFSSNGYKAGAFFDTVPIGEPATPAPATAANDNKVGETNAAPPKAEEVKTKRVPHIESFETPDERTIVIKVGRAALGNQLLSNLVAIPIIARGTAEQQKENPIGTGPFKFVALDTSQNIVELSANPGYWDGPPKFERLRLKTVTDASSLQAELQTGAVDIAPLPSNLPPDTLVALGKQDNLKVEQFDGSNIQYLIFNTQSEPLDNVKVRQAIGYAIDRNRIVSELLFGQAKVGDSILPTGSWAFTSGTQYAYDPEKARALLREAGYKDQPISFKYGSGNAAVNQYAQVIRNALSDVGLNIQIEQLEANTIRQQLAQGQFQMYTGVWIGGNQDPIFLRDLFTTGKIPGGTVNCCNRSRYSNSEVDALIETGVSATDREAARSAYTRAWGIVSNELPLLPLWYPANMVVANKRIDNIKISPSGDWTFVKDLTVAN